MPAAAPSSPGCTVYRPRRPERTCLYQAVLGHLETYLALAREGQGERTALSLPRKTDAMKWEL